MADKGYNDQVDEGSGDDDEEKKKDEAHEDPNDDKA